MLNLFLSLPYYNQHINEMKGENNTKKEAKIQSNPYPLHPAYFYIRKSSHSYISIIIVLFSAWKWFPNFTTQESDKSCQNGNYSGAH